MSSHVATAIAQFSTSALDLATTFCFLLSQDTEFPPTRTLSKSRSSIKGDPAQSASNIQQFSHVLDLLKVFISLEHILVSKNVNNYIPITVTRRIQEVTSNTNREVISGQITDEIVQLSY
uniref:Putative ovule protein n=1 Tax=Solanum chacoense TaxID=4108 RepID=A0A0V0HUH0_SOLCH